MEETTATSTASTANLAVYARSWEHLSDELKRLGLLVRLQTLALHRERLSGPLDQFKGLVITETEISELLVELEEHGAGGARSNSSASEDERLIWSLARQTSEIEGRREASMRAGIYL